MRITLASPVLIVVCALVGLTACSSAPTGPALPVAGDLLSRASTEMATVQTATFDVQVDDRATTLPVKAAHGMVTAKREVAGTASVKLGQQLLELEFVVTGQDLYVKGPTGGYQRQPAFLLTSVYDPTAILVPDKGVSKALAVAAASKDATTEAQENVGVDAYRVSTTLDLTQVPSLAPGVGATTKVTWWIATDRPRLVQARVDVPGGGALTLRFSDFDAPVTITPPA